MLPLFDTDNNRFVAIFFKLLNGSATNEEIKFAKKYAKRFLNSLNN